MDTLLQKVGMLYRDLRGWLQKMDSFGELRVVEGADRNQEIGAVADSVQIGRASCRERV